MGAGSGDLCPQASSAGADVLRAPETALRAFPAADCADEAGMALPPPDLERNAPAENSPRPRWNGRAILHGLGFWLGLAMVTWPLLGCSRGGGGVTKARGRTAHVTVVNLSDYEWKLTVRAPHGDQVRVTAIAPRAQEQMDVPAGEFEIE